MKYRTGRGFAPGLERVSSQTIVTRIESFPSGFARRGAGAGILFFLFVAIGNLMATAQNVKPVQLKIDHASVCGAKLDAMQAGFAAIGLTADYGGPHAHGGTQMALVGFEDGSYLELIAPQKQGMALDSGWAKMIAGDAGPCAWAVGTRDLSAEVARLKNSGINTQGPDAGSRKRPDGTVIEWETARAGPGTPGAVLPFMIEDKTSRSLRVQPSASARGSGLIGIEMVVIGVENLDAAKALFRRAYGWASPVVEEHREFGATLAYFAGSPVILAAPLGEHSWLTERLQRFGESPIAYLLGTRDSDSINRRFGLTLDAKWFGREVGWFDAKKLNGIRLGVIQ